MNTEFNSLKNALLARPYADGPELYHTAAIPCKGKIQTDQEAAAALANIFFYLSLIFRYPSENVYSEIQDHVAAFAGFFVDYAGAVPPLPAIEDLQAEYIRLFVNNQGFVPATPYASCYQGDGLLISDEYFRLRQIMAGSGFMLDKSVNELEDHLAVLLEFSSSLLNTLATSRRASGEEVIKPVLALLEISYCFIRPLLDVFTAKINAYAHHEFYKIAGKALKTLFQQSDPIYSELLGFTGNLRNDLQG